MSFDEIQTGCVIRYQYLWAREAAGGETEGRKKRPVVVGVRVARLSGDAIMLFPVTTKQPEADRFAVEIPDIEKKRAGLDGWRQLWILFDEYNYDVIGRSCYLEPDCLTGQLSKAFLLPYVQRVIAEQEKIKSVSRIV